MVPSAKHNKLPVVENILVAVDGSPNARKALEFAGDLALRYSAVLYILHVVPKTKMCRVAHEYIKNEGDGDPARSVYLEAVAQRIIKAAERQADDQNVKEIRPFVVHGDPAEKIIEFAEKCHINLIVLGRRGLGRPQDGSLGSVPRKVCHLTTSSCVTVKLGDDGA